MTQNISLMSQSAKYNLGAGWAGHRIKRTGWEHSMGLTLVLVSIHNLCRITSSFPKRQADQEVLRQVRLSLLENFCFFRNKPATLGLMFECMWCKTIMSHPPCSTLFPLSFHLLFAFLEQSQDSTMPGRVPQIHFSLFPPRNGRTMSKGVRLV